MVGEILYKTETDREVLFRSFKQSFKMVQLLVWSQGGDFKLGWSKIKGGAADNRLFLLMNTHYRYIQLVVIRPETNLKEKK